MDQISHLCTFKYEFGYLYLFYEGGEGPEIVYVPRGSDQESQVDKRDWGLNLAPPIYQF